MSDPKIIIIGAGAAGIGAGLECQARGIPCVIVEAADRVGGRANTATAGLQRAWDLGCHWMHSASLNPLVAYADRLGAKYSKDSGWSNSVLWSNGGIVDPDARDASEAAIEAAFDAVHTAGKGGQDMAITDILPDAGRWSACVRHVLQLDIGDDPDVASAAAHSDLRHTEEDWPVLSGYGHLIGRMARDLNIRLSTPVRAVTDHGAGVRVQTASGDMTADAAIVTVSTNVLTSGAISFAPGAAADFAQQAAHLPCGAFEKVAFTLSRFPDAMGDARHLMIDASNGAPALDFKLKDGAPPMMIATMAGSGARALMDQSGPDRIAFVRDRLCRALGSDAARLITGAACTDWLHDPLILGSYSHATPGHAQMRRDMIAADTGRIGFAGEAFSLDFQATAHGAYLSGRNVAARLAGACTL